MNRSVTPAIPLNFLKPIAKENISYLGLNFVTDSML
jgi:hypothetical protein